MIDTHCHIHDVDCYDFAFSRQQGPNKVLDRADLTPEKLVERAAKNGVTQMICIGTTHEDSMAAKALAEKFPGAVFWSYGIHPDECNKGVIIASFAEARSSRPSSRGSAANSSLTLPLRERQQPPNPPQKNYYGSLVAIGEIGLDYKDGTGRRSEQIRLFEEMLQLAKNHNLPCIFHVREAYDDFFAVLDNFPEAKGVVHSFSDSPENLQKSLEHNFYIGINGLATFSDIPTPPLEKILLETDAPFLTPNPFRGKINEPGHVKDIANWLSFKLGVSIEEIDAKTTENARQLFRIGDSIFLQT